MYVSQTFRLLQWPSSVVKFSLRSATTSTISHGENTLPSDLKPFREIPGPSGIYALPYVGAAFLFKPFSKFVPTEVNYLIDSLKDKYGDIFKMRFGKDYIVYVNHPDYAKTVMLANYEEHKRFMIGMSEIYAERTGSQKGLTILSGEEWAQVRKPTQDKMLRPAVVANYVPLIEKVTSDFVKILRKKEKIKDLRKELAKYSTESVGMLCFNKRMGCLETDSDESVANVISNVLKCQQEALFTPIKSYLYFRTKLYKRFEEENKKFQKVAYREIQSQRRFLEELENKGGLERYLEKEPNFMFSLLADGRINDAQINSVISDLFGAGIDSTANTLTFMLVDLALNQDKQQKLYDEIQAVIGDSSYLTKEHLAKMSYLKACLKETNRKTFPTSIGGVRIPESDMAVCGYHIPRDTVIAINMRSMTTDERFFPEPNKFIPERWLRETTGNIAKGKQYPFATKPFGFGARSCIGQRFAENEIYIAISKIIQNFEVFLAPGVKEIKSVYKMFTTPAEKVELFLKERKKDY